MSWHFYLFIGVAIFFIFVLPKWFKDEEARKEPEDHTINMFGGPLANSEQIVQEDDGHLPHHCVATYPPELDEMGRPPEENIVGLYVRPNYAYYQQITDKDYFYVRDLTLEEVQNLRQGQTPEIQPDDE